MSNNTLFANILLKVFIIVVLLLMIQSLGDVFFFKKTIISEDGLNHTINFTKNKDNFLVENYSKDLKMIFQNLKMENHSDYLVEFKIDKVKGSKSGYLHVDFAAPGYDNPAQEFGILLDNTIKNKHIKRTINSGDSPPYAKFRIFYDEPLEIQVSNIKLSMYKYTYNIVKYLLLIFVFSLILLIIIDVYKIDKIFAHAFVFFILTIVILLNVSPPGSGDSFWNVPTSLSILSEGNIDLNEFKEILTQDYRVKNYNGNFYNYFPIGISIITLPFVFLGNVIFDRNLTEIEIFSSLLLFALTSLFFFLLSFKITKSLTKTYVLTGIFAFATSNFHIMGGALWTHGGVELMLILALLLIFKGREENDDNWIIVSAIPMAMTYITRPTSAVFIIILSIYILIYHEEKRGQVNNT